MSKVVTFDKYAKLPEAYRKRAHEIAERVKGIDATLAPSETSDVKDAVLRMAGQFRDQPEIDHAEMAIEFQAACRDLPSWAISEAASDFLAGRVDNHTGQFMPTCAEFARHARHILVPILSERSALKTEASKLIERAEDDVRRQKIAIERSNPNVKHRVAALVKSVVSGLPKPSSITHSGLSQDRQARLDALKKPREFVSKIGHVKPPVSDNQP